GRISCHRNKRRILGDALPAFGAPAPPRIAVLALEAAREPLLVHQRALACIRSRSDARSSASACASCANYLPTLRLVTEPSPQVRTKANPQSFPCEVVLSSLDQRQGHL